MNIRKIIQDILNKKGQFTAFEIMQITGLSRQYINKSIRELRDEGNIVLVGRTNQSRYIKADKQLIAKAKQAITATRLRLKNTDISEDAILDDIKRETGIFVDLKENVSHILDYAFTEMLNNAIEHSHSPGIEIRVKRTSDTVRFDIIDKGIGIYNNIKNKRHLKNELEAIQDLLKGKQTTAPETHSGEGIFFTSKVADTFIIQSSRKKLIFNNRIDDIFIQDVPSTQGTKVTFTVSLRAATRLEQIFQEYAGESFDFDRTQVAVRLYKMGTLYISRSQGRRIMSGLDKFKTVILDFNHIKMIGQAFADEIFRVWHSHHPTIRITERNTNENVAFMISRARGDEKSA